MFKRDKISLNAIEEKHVPFLVKWGNAGGLSKQAFTKKRTNVSEQTEKVFSTFKDKANQTLIINLKDVSQPVGVCELLNIDHINKTCFLHLYLEDQKKTLGIYGFKIIQMILNYTFHRLGLYKVSVDVAIDNNIDISLYKQLSFKNEVRKRNHIFSNGSFKTIIEMSILRHEFEQQYG